MPGGGGGGGGGGFRGVGAIQGSMFFRNEDWRLPVADGCAEQTNTPKFLHLPYERCQRKDREEVQAPWHQNNLQIEGNTQGSFGANQRPPTRVEKERSRVLGTMRRMRECLHRRNRENTGEEDK